MFNPFSQNNLAKSGELWSPSHEFSYVIEERRIARVSPSDVLQSVCWRLRLNLEVLQCMQQCQQCLNYHQKRSWIAVTCIFLSSANSLFWASCRMMSGRGGADRGIGTGFWKNKCEFKKQANLLLCSVWFSLVLHSAQYAFYIIWCFDTLTFNSTSIKDKGNIMMHSGKHNLLGLIVF